MTECKVICTTLKDYRNWLDSWRGWDIEDTYILVDIGKDFVANDLVAFDIYVQNLGKFNTIKYNEYGLRSLLNFDKEVSKKHFWNSYGNRNVIWFYPHFRMLFAFTFIDKGYGHYWFFDDDVQCQDWNKFFSSFDSEYDFISYHLFKNIGVKSNPQIPELNKEMASFRGLNDNWFTRFPGDGDKLPPQIKDLYGSFYAAIRHSRDSLVHLESIHDEGFYGYSEGFVPSVLADANFKMKGIYDDSEIDEVKLTHKHVKIDWKWL